MALLTLPFMVASTVTTVAFNLETVFKNLVFSVRKPETLSH
jgi:hypothetical protein